MKKTIKFTAAVAMIGLMAFASAGCGGNDKKAAAAKDTLKFGVTNFADSLEPTDNYFGWIVMRYGLGECLCLLCRGYCWLSSDAATIMIR